PELIAALQHAPQRRMVDDFAIEDDRVATVGAHDRLMPACDIDDAEPAHAEPEVAVDEIAGIAGAAVAQPVALADDRILRHRPPSASVPAGNAAHGKLLARRLVSAPPAPDYMIRNRLGNRGPEPH